MVSSLQSPMVAFGGGSSLLLKQKPLSSVTSCHILYFLHELREYFHDQRHGGTLVFEFLLLQ